MQSYYFLIITFTNWFKYSICVFLHIQIKSSKLDAKESYNLRRLLFPLFLLIIVWLIKIWELLNNVNLTNLGVFPGKISGLKGILFSPLIHSDIAHLSANSIPLFVLTGGLFYFYRAIAWQTFLLNYFLCGFWLWFIGRPSYHIGASGIIYGLTAFLFFSGFFRRDNRLMAFSMLILFLYGGMIWGVFPYFFPNQNISFEAHLTGLISGIVLSIFFKNKGPQRKKYSWEFEEEDDENDIDNAKEIDLNS